MVKPLVTNLPMSVSQIVVASKFRYLGVKVTTQVNTYVECNSTLLFKQFKQVGTFLSKLPLETLFGDIKILGLDCKFCNCLKMKEVWLFLLPDCIIWHLNCSNYMDGIL